MEEVLNEGGRVRRRREEVVHEAAAVAVPQQSGRRLVTKHPRKLFNL